MKTVTCFYLKECPYCHQAKRVLDDLISENPAYADVPIDWIEENEHPEIIANYDYYATPSMFIGNEKLYEAHLFETYEECRGHVKEVLDRAMED
jgi:glutaredoxin